MVIGIVAAVSAIIAAVICLGSGSFENLAWLWMLPVGWIGSFFGILLLAFLAILVMTAFVDLEKEQKKDNGLYRWVLYVVADAAHTVLQVRVCVL